MARLWRLARRLLPGPGVPAARRRAYEREYARVASGAEGWEVLRQPMYDAGEHPQGYVDFECRFTALHLRSEAPRTVLDVGSYRAFVIGLAAHCEVTSLDVRHRDAGPGPETVLTSDAREIAAPDASFDAVVTLSSVEHFGLGRYGDALDLGADRAAVREMVRVLRPGGVLLLTTTATGGAPTIAFNAHRIYAPRQVRDLLSGMERVDERFYSHRRSGECTEEQLTRAPGDWDVYCGCWRKPAAPGRP